MRILVTGATGFLGGAVVRTLAAHGHQVLATGRDQAKGARLADAGIRFEPAELCDRPAVHGLCEGIEAVVHCAARSSPWGAERGFVRDNVEATDAVIDACLAQRVSRLIHVSTPSLYMDGRDREQIREDEPLPPPINHYAATKRLCEEHVRRAAGEGLGSIILRPRAIFGPGDTTIFPRVLRALETGRLPVIGSGDNRVDLTYIDNAVQAVERALAAPSRCLGRTYNVSDGEPVLLWGVLRWLCDELGLPPPRGSLPRSVALALAGGLELYHRLALPEIEPKLTRYSVQVLACHLTLDIRRARDELGYRPEVSVHQGLERFVSWWVEAGGSAREQNVEAGGSAREQNVEAGGSAREQD